MEHLSGIVYGVRLHGRLPADFAPCLSPAEAGAEGLAEVEVEVIWREVDRLPPFEATWTSEPAPGEAALRFSLFPHAGHHGPEGFGLAVRGEEAGLFRCTPERIDVEWASDPAGAPNHLVTYLLPLWLEARGVPVLHGSAVTIGGSAVGFLGPSGVGKSTLAAELVRRGCGFVADDGLALHHRAGAWHCLAGPPLARLWPSALRDRLGVEPAGLPRVRGAGDKRRWEMTAEATRPGGHRLAALYLLDRRAGADGPPRSTPQDPKQALLRLLEHGVAAAPAAALGLSERRLDRLAEVAESVPIRRLSFPGHTDTAAAILEAITEDLDATRPP